MSDCRTVHELKVQKASAELRAATHDMPYADYQHALGTDFAHLL